MIGERAQCVAHVDIVREIDGDTVGEHLGSIVDVP
jgi:hypothetical protein